MPSFQYEALKVCLSIAVVLKSTLIIISGVFE